MNKVDLLIVGAGPVGLYANYLANKYRLSCMCLEATNHIGGQLHYRSKKDVLDHDIPNGWNGRSTVKDFIDTLNRNENSIILVSIKKGYTEGFWNSRMHRYVVKDIAATNILLCTGNGIPAVQSFKFFDGKKLEDMFPVFTDYPYLPNRKVLMASEGSEAAKSYYNDLLNSGCKVTLLKHNWVVDQIFLVDTGEKRTILYDNVVSCMDIDYTQTFNIKGKHPYEIHHDGTHWVYSNLDHVFDVSIDEDQEVTNILQLFGKVKLIISKLIR